MTRPPHHSNPADPPPAPDRGELLAARAAGEDFPGAAPQELDRLLVTDADAADELAGLEQVMDLLRESAVQPSARRRERVLRAVEPGRRPQIQAWWRRPTLAVAAVLLVAATVALALLLLPVPDDGAGNGPVAHDNDDDHPVTNDDGAGGADGSDEPPGIVAVLVDRLGAPRRDGERLTARDFATTRGGTSGSDGGMDGGRDGGSDGSGDGGRTGGGTEGGPGNDAQDHLQRIVDRDPGFLVLAPRLPDAYRLTDCRLLRAGDPGVEADTLWLVWSGPAGPIALLQTASANPLPDVALAEGWHQRERVVGDRTAVRVLTPAVESDALDALLDSLKPWRR